MQLNIHKKERYLMSITLLEQIDETGVFKYIFQNKISKLIMLIILLEVGFFLQKHNLHGASKYHYHEDTRLCPFNEHLKPCYGK